MNKEYLDKLFKLADKVLPEANKCLRSKGEPLLASKLIHFYGFLEAMRTTPNE